MTEGYSSERTGGGSPSQSQFQIPGSDFPRSVFRSCTRQKDFTRVFMQSERLYVINTAEGKWTQREVEEEKTGIMQQQHNSP